MNGGLNKVPFKDLSVLDHSNTKHVQNLNPFFQTGNKRENIGSKIYPYPTTTESRLGTLEVLLNYFPSVTWIPNVVLFYTVGDQLLSFGYWKHPITALLVVHN